MGHTRRGHDALVPLRVVLVDDDARYRRVARRTLELEGAPVVAEAADGCEALRILRDRRADVALLDIGLPPLRGTEVARRLRAAGATPIVILVSTRDPDYGRRAPVADNVRAAIVRADATGG